MKTFINNVYRIIFRIRRGIERRLFLLFNSRPSSTPFISGDGFRKISHHVYEKRTVFNPMKIVEKEIVFLEVELLDKYFEEIHPKINCNYILITHNGDNEINKEIVNKYLDNKIIHWFAQNVSVDHPKLTPIPIGLENRKYCNNGVISYLKKATKSSKEKINKILYGFNILTNLTERQAAYNILSKLTIGDKIDGWPFPKEYFEMLARYKFVASPPGNGIDCHRTWEAMYLETVPIVKDSLLVQYFRSLNLPLWVVTDWKELSLLSEQEFGNIYLKITKESNKEALHMDYWIKKINQFR